MKKKRNKSLPDSLSPVEELLTKSKAKNLEAEDKQEVTEVLQDWLQQQPEQTAHDMWLLNKPSAYQAKVTIAVIGRGTALEYVSRSFETFMKDNQLARSFMKKDALTICKSALQEAQRQLSIHKHAMWVRWVTESTVRSARPNEAVMNYSFYANGVPSSLSYGNPHSIDFRTTCQTEDCVFYSLANVLITN